MSISSPLSSAGAPVDRAALRGPDGRPIRVLVVDDEQTLSELVGLALRYEGWDVRTAADGLSAIAAAREFRPDLVVLDVMLPDIDGLEVLRRLRADIERMPVLFLTARDDVSDRIAGLTAGGDDYVTKPFSIEELVLRLRALLRRSHLALTTDSSTIVVGDLVLDEDSREVRRGDDLISADRHRVRTAALPDAESEAGDVQGADPGPGLELRFRRSGEHRRALHFLPAEEDRRRTGTDDPHHEGLRLCPQARHLTGELHDRRSHPATPVRRNGDPATADPARPS